MLRISQIKLNPGHTRGELEAKIIKSMHIHKEELLEFHIIRQSVDARKKPEIFYVYTVDVKVRHENQVHKRLGAKAQLVKAQPYLPPKQGTKQLHKRPVIVGSGPAGLFCAYLLASQGYHPLLLERGKAVDQRQADVERFWETGKLDPESNVQFGEGGAGTFSDGKLNTLVKDPFLRSRFVLETFVEHGAPESILYEQKPHIGTDVLVTVVKNMRNSIEKMGGEVRFQSRLTDIEISDGNQRIKSAIINGEEHMETDVLILALGHSARDTFQMLYAHEIPMQAKSFAVGVRVEHPQSMIDKCQYGGPRGKNLPAAAYKLTARSENGRGVYTFCMCPGGYVVNASSEENLLAVNGMSYHDRAGENANSAVIVTVSPDDYGSSRPLAGVEFQRELEEKAWKAGRGKVPVQLYGDFCKNQITRELGEITPCIKGDYTFGDVRNIFPEYLAQALEEGIRAMDSRIHGFARTDVVISGVESRTSSPIRIQRDEKFESSICGIYPCGEGAGYAGGITSAAMDGLKTAEAVIRKFNFCERSFTKN